MRLFITGIGTDVGKTVVSAMFAEALQADYWKPIQAGSLEHTDSDTVRELVTNTKGTFHPEAFKLSQPLSPHAAAKLDGVEINLEKLIVPSTPNAIIIEGPGGLLVPLGGGKLVVDLIAHFDAQPVIVSKHYLGSINHTLLTCEALKRRGYSPLGIMFVGEPLPDSESEILEQTKLRKIGHVPWSAKVDKEFVSEYAAKLRQVLQFVMRMRLEPS